MAVAPEWVYLVVLRRLAAEYVSSFFPMLTYEERLFHGTLPLRFECRSQDYDFVSKANVNIIAVSSFLERRFFFGEDSFVMKVVGVPSVQKCFRKGTCSYISCFLVPLM